VHQAGFSCDFCHPLVTTVRNATQIANEIVAHFKTEFFNSIEGKADVQNGQFCENLGDIPECPLFSKADVQMPQNP
jgi:hypothetical protein